MVPEKQIDEFVNRARTAVGEALQSVILYGSAATGDFHPDISNVNLLCVLRNTSYSTLEKLSPVVEWWTRKKYPAPLVMTQTEIERSADVFSIELFDIQQRHRVLFGDDVLNGLRIPMQWHRAQLEYEMREKLILLRERMLAASGDKSRLWDLLLHSLPAFTTLFRHALMTMGEPVPTTKREAVQTLATRLAFDPAPFSQLLDIREKKAQRSQFDVRDIFARYLIAVEQVTAAVDTMLDSAGSQAS
ncbi:MAG TPA: nucleotidyltransferase domain-containing protein [Terriglobales bacterium]|nr:nucleotidyltransferase domain-containing protein [Terriglobales bacterium]